MHFGRHRIDPARHSGRATEDLSPDPGDRIHVAACIYGEVEVLVTHNTKDYRATPITAAAVAIMTADAFLRDCSRGGHRRRPSPSRAARRKPDPPATEVDLVVPERAG